MTQGDDVNIGIDRSRQMAALISDTYISLLGVTMQQTSIEALVWNFL
jgi:hypothetical protein